MSPNKALALIKERKRQNEPPPDEVLAEEVQRLRRFIEEAFYAGYHQGFNDGEDPQCRLRKDKQRWLVSNVRALLETNE